MGHKWDVKLKFRQLGHHTPAIFSFLLLPYQHICPYLYLAREVSPKWHAPALPSLEDLTKRAITATLTGTENGIIAPQQPLQGMTSHPVIVTVTRGDLTIETIETETVIANENENENETETETVAAVIEIPEIDLETGEAREMTGDKGIEEGGTILEIDGGEMIGIGVLVAVGAEAGVGAENGDLEEKGMGRADYPNREIALVRSHVHLHLRHRP